jgi:hypothetical protein
MPGDTNNSKKRPKRTNSPPETDIDINVDSRFWADDLDPITIPGRDRVAENINDPPDDDEMAKIILEEDINSRLQSDHDQSKLSTYLEDNLASRDVLEKIKSNPRDFLDNTIVPIALQNLLLDLHSSSSKVKENAIKMALNKSTEFQEKQPVVPVGNNFVLPPEFINVMASGLNSLADNGSTAIKIKDADFREIDADPIKRIEKNE